MLDTFQSIVLLACRFIRSNGATLAQHIVCGSQLLNSILQIVYSVLLSFSFIMMYYFVFESSQMLQ